MAMAMPCYGNAMAMPWQCHGNAMAMPQTNAQGQCKGVLHVLRYTKFLEGLPYLMLVLKVGYLTHVDCDNIRNGLERNEQQQE